MMNRSLMQRLARWLAVAVLLGAALGAGLGAMAQAEPTLKQIYDAAQAGRLEQAQTMIQQVLVLHPKSAKAHFVQAELAARQGQIARAREALAEAEKLAPGLPFAKPEAVQSLRAALVAQPATAVKPGAMAQAPQAAPFAVSTAPAPASSSQIGLGIALGGAAIALAIYLVRRKPAPVPAPQAGYGSPAAAGSGLSGPQTFGTDVSAAPGSGQAPYGPAPGGGLGGKVIAGLATGLAVGAGVVAAQAIGKSLMGDHGERAPHPAAGSGLDEGAFARNADMGGENFGIRDAGGWDDGASLASSDDGGGDWDT